jgi:hypothetical protein
VVNIEKKCLETEADKSFTFLGVLVTQKKVYGVGAHCAWNESKNSKLY